MSHVTLWSADSWSPRLSFDYYLSSGLVFDPRGERATIATAEGQVALIDMRTGKRIDRPQNDAHRGGDYAVDVEFTRDGSILVADESAGLQLLDGKSLRQKTRPEAHSLAALNRETSPDGKLIAAVERPVALALLRASDLSRVRTLEKSSDATTYSFAWIDARHLVARRGDGEIRLWADDGTSIVVAKAEVDLKPRCTPTISANADRSRFLSVHSDCALSVWNAPGAEKAFEVDSSVMLKGAPTSLDSSPLEVEPWVSWSPKGDRLALRLPSREISILDAKTGRTLATRASSSAGAVDTLQWLPSNDVVLAAAGGSLSFLKIDAKTLDMSEFEVDGGRLVIALSNDGAFDGPEDLAACGELFAGREGVAPHRNEPSLVSDFFGVK